MSDTDSRQRQIAWLPRMPVVTSPVCHPVGCGRRRWQYVAAPDPDSDHGAVQGDDYALLEPIARRLGLVAADTAGRPADPLEVPMPHPAGCCP